MKICIWGARGSIPSPLRPEAIEKKICQIIYGMPPIDTNDMAAIKEHLQELPPLLRGTAGGNTTCVEVQVGGELIVIDAGSGIRELGLKLMKGAFGQGKGKLHLLFSHPHWDHIQGFPFFNPAFIPGNEINIYCIHDLKNILTRQQNQDNFPVPLSGMQATINFITVELGQPFEIGPARINTVLNAHPGKAYSFRIEDEHSVFVHASDSEYKNLDEDSVQTHINFFRNADALIFDAQYTLKEAWQKEDWGHSSALIGTDLARAAEVKRLILFHHDPTYSDTELQEIQLKAIAYQIQDQTRPQCEVIVAYEGLTLDLTPPDVANMQLSADSEARILTPLNTFNEMGEVKASQQLTILTEHSTTATPIIDLSQLDTLTTASLKTLVSLREKTGDHPIVLAGPSSTALRIIKLGGYKDFFAIYPSVEAAVSALQTREQLNLPGQLIKQRYQIESKLGESALGTLLAATDLVTEKKVALKILSPALSPETVNRFMTQSQKLMQLNHPNISKVITWEQTPDFTFRVSELITGPTLHTIIYEEKGPLPGNQALDYATIITRALEHAHSHGVVHGDLKPQNVFITPKGLKLNDFGLGRLEEGRNLLDAPMLHLNPAYVAPEQIIGQTIDARTDLYALGVILYQLFTGELPFTGTDQQIMYAHLSQEPRPPREIHPYISPSLEFLILKLLAKNPNNRYNSAEQTQRISSRLIINMGDSQVQPQTHLVGRQSQQKQLRACWEKAQQGHGQLAFISGEMGVGKTSLAMRISTQDEPHILLIGHCLNPKRHSAYHPFIEILRVYFSTAPPEYSDEGAYPFLSNLSHLVPEIKQALPHLPDPPPLAPKQEQLRLMSNLTGFIKRASHERPWLLIIEDLHQADQSSLDILRYLAHHLSSMALMIVGTYQTGALKRGNPLLETLRDLNNYASYHQLPLGRLSRSETATLLSNIWQQDVPENLVDKIYQLTEGNPTFVEEVANGLIEQGLATGNEGDWQFKDLKELQLPKSIHEAVWNRLKHLTPDLQALLHQAAVLGTSFRFKDLHTMSKQSEWQALEHLDTALEHQLIQEAPGEGYLRFTHPEIQYVLYHDTGPLRKRMLHLQAGEALEQNAMPEPERIADELAHHFIEAGEFERALIYSIQAARWAQSTYANETAILWYQRTLEILDKLDPEEAMHFQSLRLSVNKHLGQILTLIGDYDAALSCLSSARALSHHEPTPQAKKRQQADLCCQTAAVYEKREEYDLAFDWLERGLHHLGKDEQTIEKAKLFLLGARLYQHQESFSSAIEWCQKSLAISRAINSYEGEQTSGQAYHRLGTISVQQGYYQEAIEYATTGLNIFKKITYSPGQAECYETLGDSQAISGDWRKAQTNYQAGLKIAQSIGDLEKQAHYKTKISHICLYQGQWKKAIGLLKQSLAIWEQTGHSRFTAYSYGYLAQVYLFRKNWPKAYSYLEQSKAGFNKNSSDESTVELEILLGRYYLGIEAPDKALSYAKHAVEMAQMHRNPLAIGQAYRLLGQVYLSHNKFAPAEKYLNKGYEIFNNLSAKYEIAKTEYALAQLAQTTQQTDAMGQFVSSARQSFSALNARFDLEAIEKLTSL